MPHQLRFRGDLLGCPRCEQLAAATQYGFTCELCGRGGKWDRADDNVNFPGAPRRRLLLTTEPTVTPSPMVLAAFRLGGIEAAQMLLAGTMHTYGKIEGST